MVFRVCLMVLLTAALSGGAEAAAVAVAAADPAPKPAPGAAPVPSLDHIAGTKRRIRMIFRTHFLQLLPNGNVRGTPNDTLLYAVLQRTSVTMGKVKIQGVTTCMYLCMNNCGMPYASKYFTDECVFNENIEINHYNTYSSGKYSNKNRTLYVGLTPKGMARPVVIRDGNTAKLEMSRVLTLTVQSAELEALGAGPRCPQDGSLAQGEQRPTPPVPIRCKRPNGRRRKKKRCRPDGGNCPIQEGGGPGQPRRKGPMKRRKGGGGAGGGRERPGGPRERRPRPVPPTEGQTPHRVRHRKHRTASGIPPPFLLEDELPTTTITSEDDPHFIASSFDDFNDSHFEDNESE